MWLHFPISSDIPLILVLCLQFGKKELLLQGWMSVTYGPSRLEFAGYVFPASVLSTRINLNPGYFL